MNVGIVGFGREGKMALEYWQKPGVSFFIYDKDTSLKLPDEAQGRLGEKYKEYLLDDVEQLDLIVRSPGIPLWDIESQLGEKLTTITKEFFNVCPCKIIGITGTKGKGTTATLIYEILKNEGKDVYLVGNIGKPALSILPNVTKDSIVVYELSSFQLFDLHKSPDIGVCLLITEDHLDWHKDLDHYQSAKASIFKYQKESDTAIWFKGNAVTSNLATLSKAKERISFGENADVTVDENNFFVYKSTPICKTSEVALPGKHNQQNICAAIAATYDLVSQESIVKTLREFSGLPFHIEKVGVHNGITFINDSFSVNPTSTEVAIASMNSNTTLLIGGVDRGLHLDPFVTALQASSKIKHIIVYGEERERIRKILADANIPCVVVDSNEFESVFKKALEVTVSGETILFSPGAPSFDMFRDYQERGEVFNRLVEKYTRGLL